LVFQIVGTGSALVSVARRCQRFGDKNKKGRVKVTRPTCSR